MKIYQVIFFTIGTIEIVTCFGMDEEQKIKNFVTRINQPKEEISFPFLLSMERAYPEFAKYFPQKKSISSPNIIVAVQSINIRTIQYPTHIDDKSTILEDFTQTFPSPSTVKGSTTQSAILETP